MKKMSKQGIIQLIIPLIIMGVCLAAVPQVINYQGRLTDASGNPVADNNYLIKFKIYGSAAGNDSLWSSGFQTVAVANGLFTYKLGTPTAFPQDLFVTGTSRYLGITVGVDLEISPRTEILSSAYARHSVRADTADEALTVHNGSIYDLQVNATANISPSKISGTAATLSTTQTFTAGKTFDSYVYIGDSTFRADDNGIRIGRAGSTTGSYMIYGSRDYNTIYARDGMRLEISNVSYGNIKGLNSIVESKPPGTGGTIHGVYGDATGDGEYRYGVQGIARAQNSSITTGYSYGIVGSAYHGATACGVYGTASFATSNWAGYFSGNAHVTGTLRKGGGAFRIDHPLDPENKYLQHSFVESPDMMNIYNGNIITDENGNATIYLPDYFDAINADFRYQLTPIGQFAAAIVSEEISGNRFSIRTDKPNVKVSWQVTGIRKDPFANANRIQVEIDKKPEEIGKYAHAEAYGLPIERSVDYESLKKAEENRLGNSSYRSRENN
jgi:hypothetical protein